MPNKLFAELSDEQFEDEFFLSKTPENVNFMYAVVAIDNGGSDLTALLKELDDNYSGVINIHEGFGGVEADSNQDLISQKIEFDLRENFEYHNVRATHEAIELNWINYTHDQYQELLTSLEEYQDSVSGRD